MTGEDRVDGRLLLRHPSAAPGSISYQPNDSPCATSSRFGPRPRELQEEADGEAGKLVIDQAELADRRVCDASSRQPVLWWLTSSVVWLLLGSVVDARVDPPGEPVSAE